jgi:hypothetical protein
VTKGGFPEIPESQLEIRREGWLLALVKGLSLEFPDIGCESLLARQPVDITGNGVPDIVVRTFSRGAHCCTTTYVFELGKTFHAFEPIKHVHGEVQDSFVQADNDPELEVIVRDWTFAYWHLCYASSPAPEVLLDLRRNASGPHPEWVFANQKEPVSTEHQKQLEGRARRSAASEDGPLEEEALSMFLKDILDLLYSGNAKAARAHIDRAFAGRDAEKLGFLMDFGAQLSQSDYAYDILRLNEVGSFCHLLLGHHPCPGDRP